MNQLFYDFRFGGTNAGYYTVIEDGDTFHMELGFDMEGKIQYSFFSFRHDGSRVLACRMGSGDWTSQGLDSPDHFPASAYPLLLRTMAERRSYIAVMDGVGCVLGETLLIRTGNMVREIQDAAVIREFELRDGIPVRINWVGGTNVHGDELHSGTGRVVRLNGPISTLCASREEAVRGTRFELLEA